MIASPLLNLSGSSLLLLGYSPTLKLREGTMDCLWCFDLLQCVLITELGVGVVDRVTMVLQSYLSHVIRSGPCEWKFIFTTNPKPSDISPSACLGTSNLVIHVMVMVNHNISVQNKVFSRPTIHDVTSYVIFITLLSWMIPASIEDIMIIVGNAYYVWNHARLLVPTLWSTSNKTSSEGV